MRELQMGGTGPAIPLVRVGGGFLFGAFNERQFLDRLRTLDGQTPRYARLGSTTIEGYGHPLDVYSLSVDGPGDGTRVLMDLYDRGTLDAPPGFGLVDAGALDLLPRGIGSPPDWIGPQAGVAAGPRRWRVTSGTGDVAGFAAWEGDGKVELNLTPHVQQVMQARLDHFLGLAPPHGRGAMLTDFFERYLPLESGGLLRGVAIVEQGVAPWTGERWGTPDPAPPRKKWYWPW